MGRQVMRAEIRLHFDDFPDALEAAVNVNEPFAEQFPGDDGGIPVIKRVRQLLHGGIIPTGRQWKTRFCPEMLPKKCLPFPGNLR